jgi:hypothetical protein
MLKASVPLMSAPSLTPRLRMPSAPSNQGALCARWLGSLPLKTLVSVSMVHYFTVFICPSAWYACLLQPPSYPLPRNSYPLLSPAEE